MPGAIEDFDRIRFGGPTMVEEFKVTLGPLIQPILKADPDRVMVIMSNNDTIPAYWSTLPTLVVVDSFIIGAGIVTTFQVQNDGALCGRALFGYAPAGICEINVLVLRRYQRG